MAWNYETAYAGDWAFIDGVESATLTPKDAAQDGAVNHAVKILWDTDEVNNMPTGQRLGLAPKESALCLWVAGSAAPDPAHGDLLTIDSVTFTVLSSASTRRSVFAVVVQQQLVNT